MLPMIFDKAENLELYRGIHPNMGKVIDFIRDFLASGKPDGHYDIDGREVFANVFTNPTGPDEEKRFETHDNYIDLQLVLAGGQTIFTADREGMIPTVPYDGEKDITFYAEVPGTRCELTAGKFLWLFPGDAHRPDCKLAGYENARKMVVKVHI